MAQGVDGYWYAYIGAYGFIDTSGTEDYDSVQITIWTMVSK